MRFRSILLYSLFAIIVFSIYSCDKTTIEQYPSAEPLSDYLPIQVGKYITYRVDSTVFTNFGRNQEIHYYQVKHVIDALVTDNLGRPSYRVFRYINDSTGSSTWTPNGSYFITPVGNTIEIIEDNLRFIKLSIPIHDGFSWKGNTYLAPDPYNSLYSFSNDDDMSDWDYYYDTIDSPFSYSGHNYTNVTTVEQANESINVPITNTAGYASITRVVEKYSKNIGLVYRENTMWEYQPNTGGPGGYQVGFGMKMWMVDHN